MRIKLSHVTEEEFPNAEPAEKFTPIHFIDYNGKELEDQILAIDTQSGEALIYSSRDGQCPILDSSGKNTVRETKRFIAPLTWKQS